MFAGADFAAATVTMQYNGANVPVQLEPISQSVYCMETLVWIPEIDWMEFDRDQDHTFQVEVSGVKVNGEDRTFAYDVTVVFPVVGTP